MHVQTVNGVAWKSYGEYRNVARNKTENAGNDDGEPEEPGNNV